MSITFLYTFLPKILGQLGEKNKTFPARKAPYTRLQHFQIYRQMTDGASNLTWVVVGYSPSSRQQFKEGVNSGTGSPTQQKRTPFHHRPKHKSKPPIPNRNDLCLSHRPSPSPPVNSEVSKTKHYKATKRHSRWSPTPRFVFYDPRGQIWGQIKGFGEHTKAKNLRFGYLGYINMRLSETSDQSNARYWALGTP